MDASAGGTHRKSHLRVSRGPVAHPRRRGARRMGHGGTVPSYWFKKGTGQGPEGGGEETLSEGWGLLW